MSLSQNYCNVKHCSEVCRDFGAFEKKNQPFTNEFNKCESVPDAYLHFSSKNHLNNSENFTKPIYNSHKDEIEDPVFKPGVDGTINWTPLANLTGTRPNVSKYSLEKLSLDEWRKLNEELLDSSVLHDANYAYFNGKSAISTAHGITDLEQIQTTNRIKYRAKEIYRWKVEFEQSCKAVSEEIRKLENEKTRVKKACESLVIPELLTNECIQLRSNRRTRELVNDFTEIELTKEKSLEKKVKELFNDALRQTEEQLKANRKAKQTVEYGLTDKVVAHDSETVNLELNTKSNRIMFKPGSVKLTDNNSTPELYDYWCRKTLQDVEAARQKSIDLRASICATIQDGAASLRHQADSTDMALVKTISVTTEACYKTKQGLRDTLDKIANMERLIEDLHSAIRKMDAAMKLAQTRLESRNQWRPHVENVRDTAQNGLVHEVKTIHNTVTSLRQQLTTAYSTRKQLEMNRSELERDIADKLNTVYIDKGRCEVIRSHFPTVNEICGYTR